MQARINFSIISCVAILAAACAGKQGAAESADAESTSTTEAAPKADESTTTEADTPATDEAKAEAEPEPAAPKGPPPSEILTTEDVAFTFDYNTSAMKAKHEEKCAPTAKDDPAVLTKCMENERKDFHADVLWFRKDAETGEMLFIVYKRQAQKLSEVFRSSFVFEEEAGTGVTIKLVGQAKGSQQIYAGRKAIPVQVPNKYSVVIDDPKYGELKYNSKVGLVNTQSQ